jgi:hypothetical protein
MGGLRRHGLAALAVLSAVGTLLVTPAVAGALTSFKWAGKASLSSWSELGNWESGTAPSGKVETLTFPALTSSACTPVPPTAACYSSADNLTGVEANELVIDDGVGYFISGANPLTLGAGGLKAMTSSADTTATANLSLPIALSAPQTWTIAGGTHGQQLGVGQVTGAPSDTLGIEFTGGTFLDVNGNIEVGAVTATGAPGAVALSPGGAASLNGTDGEPVSFNGGAGLAAFSGASGPLVFSGGTLQVGETCGGCSDMKLAVNGGVTLSATSTFLLFMNQPGGTVGTDYSQLSASGTVNLAGATLDVLNGGGFSHCEALTPGEVDTLIAAGKINGVFGNAANEAVISLGCGGGVGTAPTVKIHYTSTTMTATVLTSGSSGTKEEEEKTKHEEEARKQEEAERKQHEEEARKRGEEEAAKKKHQEEEATAKKHLEEEAVKKKAEEEAAAKKHLEEEAAKKPPPTPVLTKTASVAAVSGQVLALRPGTGKLAPLTVSSEIPFGIVINATNGTVSVTTATPGGATQTLTLSGGEFVLTQRPNGAVLAALAGGDYSVCPTARERSHVARAASKHASGNHVVRKLWAEGHGHFATKGTYAVGGVLGTRWLTEDLCEGTLIHVATDRVAVTNLVNHRRATVKAGHSYLAKAP